MFMSQKKYKHRISLHELRKGLPISWVLFPIMITNCLLLELFRFYEALVVVYYQLAGNGYGDQL